MQLSEQEIIRRQSKEELEKLGFNPYPADLFEVNVSAKNILDNYERNKTDYKNISIAGRIMSRRIMGSASFAELQDETGRIQIYLRRDDLCPTEDKTLYNVVFKKLLDIGDIVGADGEAPGGDCEGGDEHDQDDHPDRVVAPEERETGPPRGRAAPGAFPDRRHRPLLMP